MPRPRRGGAPSAMRAWASPGDHGLDQGRERYRALAGSWRLPLALLFEDREDVARGQHEVLLAGVLDLGAAILAVEHDVADRNVERDAVAVVVEAAGADGDNSALLWLFLRGIRNDDARGSRRLGLVRLDHEAVLERFDADLGGGHGESPLLGSICPMAMPCCRRGGQPVTSWHSIAVSANSQCRGSFAHENVCLIHVFPASRVVQTVRPSDEIARPTVVDSNPNQDTPPGLEPELAPRRGQVWPPSSLRYVSSDETSSTDAEAAPSAEIGALPSACRPPGWNATPPSVDVAVNARLDEPASRGVQRNVTEPSAAVAIRLASTSPVGLCGQGVLRSVQVWPSSVEVSSVGCWDSAPPAGCLRISRNAALPFFFQAEDGIRDLYVTGVQTCALPI